MVGGIRFLQSAGAGESILKVPGLMLVKGHGRVEAGCGEGRLDALERTGKLIASVKKQYTIAFEAESR